MSIINRLRGFYRAHRQLRGSVKSRQNIDPGRVRSGGGGGGEGVFTSGSRPLFLLFGKASLSSSAESSIVTQYENKRTQQLSSDSLYRLLVFASAEVAKCRLAKFQ